MPIYNDRWTLNDVLDRVFEAPIPLELEIVIVDDGSTDGSWDALQDLAHRDDRVRVIRHPQHCGRGAAIRTAIGQMTGDVVVVQDANLEYDPNEFEKLLMPILEDRADAVFGSRFTGETRRVLSFWNAQKNRLITLLSNMFNDQCLTDMASGYKMVRADVLRQLRLASNGFGIEAELTCRLAQYGARIYEVPISYFDQSDNDGRRISAVDGLKAIWEMIRCRYIKTEFTDHSGFYILSSVARAAEYNKWILDQVQPFLGSRILEAGAGIGNLSSLLLDRERLVLVDYENMYTDKLEQRYAGRRNIRVDRADLTRASEFHRWQNETEAVQTIFCSNVLEHLEPDQEVLQNFYNTLVPGGYCIIVVPAGQWLYTPMDKELGHFRRYSQQELADKMQNAGFDVAFTRQFNRVGSISWGIAGHLFRRRHLSPRQMIWFDRLLPIFRLFEYLLPIPGMSLIMVGQKQKSVPAVVRKAA